MWIQAIKDVRELHLSHNLPLTRDAAREPPIWDNDKVIKVHSDHKSIWMKEFHLLRIRDLLKADGKPY